MEIIIYTKSILLYTVPLVSEASTHEIYFRSVASCEFKQLIIVAVF